MEKITGKNNSLIKDVKKLLSSPKERRQQCLFVLEGARLVFDVLHSFYEVKYFLITESALNKYEEQAKRLMDISENSFLISQEISEKISDTQSSQGVFAVCKMKNKKEEIVQGKKYIALDNLQDPSNLGAVSRTAEALGIDGVIVFSGCDMYNPKALRASMGSLLRIPVIESGNLAETLTDAKKIGYRVYSSVPDRKAVKMNEIDFALNSICVIGNEANGISDEVKAVSDVLVTIPMQGRAESLNASAAASIIIWEMLR